MLLETLMILESLRVLIEDKIIFVEAVCAGPGRENACRGRAGARLRFFFDLRMYTNLKNLAVSTKCNNAPQSLYRNVKYINHASEE